MTNGKQRRHWGLVAPFMPARDIAAQARLQEDAGLAGTFAAQVFGPPFAPLAVAATSTTALQLGSGVAIALARSPFETAMAAIDLDRMSEGRFVLGLGASVKAWTHGLFGMPYTHPVAQLRETVAAIRHVVAGAHHERLANFEGRYWQLDFTELQPPPPPPRSHIPIWISALRGPMTRLGAEIGDGLIGHPIWSLEWVRTSLAKELAAGLARGGRTRRDLEVNLWFWATPNRDVRQSIEDGRAVVAFYAGIAQYEPYFVAHGYGAECRRLQEAVQRGAYQVAAATVPDAMVETFVLTGTPDTVRRKLDAAWDVADSVCVIPPLLSLAPDATSEYFKTIAETLY